MQHCASCHGKAGEGVKDEYDQALVGDKSVLQLAKYIDKWMPEDEPKTVVGEDAEHVARYIHEAFYSPIAQARHAPARIALSRLTVRQYRNTVADLVGSFRSPIDPGPDPERGLKGEYFNSRQPGRNGVIERVDPEVRFDFGQQNPAPDKLDDPNGFSVRWEGSLIAPDTGDYEIIIRTDHAARLWLNNREEALIDRWVKSGSDTEFRAMIYLIEGRAYPLRLEFSTHKQGVDDKKKQQEPLKAFVELLWRRPHQAAEVIPQRCLSPKRVDESFVVTTPFPPDDRSVGYERGTSVSQAWANATTDAALETAAYVTEHLDGLAGIGRRDSAEDRAAKTRQFAARFIERAFRRPVNDELAKLFVESHFEAATEEAAGDTASDPVEVQRSAIKRIVLLALKSPRFLYVDFANDKPDDYDTATRLSYTLWDSMPDAALFEAASKGELRTPQQIRAQAERMVNDARAKSKLLAFLHQWLRVDHLGDLSKDPGKYPDFTPEIASDLHTSLDLFLDEVMWDEHSDFRRLLFSHDLYVNGRLAGFYGIDLPADAPFQKVAADRPQRVGVISHPLLLAGFAYSDVSSPIHRGVFLARSVLGRSLKPPPEAVAPLAPDLHPDLTTRQRVVTQTADKACMACHGMINSLGFTLEHFDAVGRFRETEKDKPVDSTGAYELPDGEQQPFADARELAAFLADHEQVHQAFALQLFHNFVKQPAAAYGAETAANLRAKFAEDQFNVRRLMVRIAEIAAGPGE